MSHNGINTLLHRIHEHKSGAPVGVFSICSSHPTILENALNYSVQKDFPLLIETTSNQVNQFGGYSGQTPVQFSAYMKDLGSRFDFPKERLILGGDHLGPFPWRGESSQSAMDKACQMTQDYISAGYRKIHLDASMPCADDNSSDTLNPQISAQRSAVLCQAAEKAFIDQKPDCVYVIGSEVPAPGGDQAGDHSLQVTTPESVSDTIERTKQEFIKRDLHSAWERVIAVVVQPGVEFYEQSVHHYNSAIASNLSTFIEDFPQFIFEAHSTDYQTADSLNQLVQNHFAILKVGPELTYRYREIIFTLEQIELQIAKYRTQLIPSRISQIIDEEMIKQPEYWKAYYSGNQETITFSRKYSYLDRIRYYWNRPGVKQAVKKLFFNLNGFPISETLISQYLPESYQKIMAGHLDNHPESWVDDRIYSVLQKYDQAISSSRS